MLNLTQHTATTEQVSQGVVDLPEADRAQLVELLTIRQKDLYFRSGHILAGAALSFRTDALVDLALKHDAPGDDRVMVGGHPAIMAPLERRLRAAGFQPCYAFSERVVVEDAQPDGSVRKTSTFRHLGFIAGPPPLRSSDPVVVVVRDARQAGQGVILRAQYIGAGGRVSWGAEVALLGNPELPVTVYRAADTDLSGWVEVHHDPEPSTWAEAARLLRVRSDVITPR